ncbi:MAG: hypothetical protein U9M89_01315 [Patescibacteria group bacterium]|nr:hypothetical protein [Patescibacteria group bacterium]
MEILDIAVPIIGLASGAYTVLKAKSKQPYALPGFLGIVMGGGSILNLEFLPEILTTGVFGDLLLPFIGGLGFGMFVLSMLTLGTEGFTSKK